MIKRIDGDARADQWTCADDLVAASSRRPERPEGRTPAQDPLSCTGVYVLRDGEEIGPLGLAQARQLMAAGRISRNDLVKLGLKGRPFPASVLADSVSESLQ